jgi:hypothetical protein
MKMIAKTLAAASMAVGFAAAANAATIVPIGAAASSSFSGYGSSNAIDANPLSDWATQNQGTGAGGNILLDLGGYFNVIGASITDRVTSGGGNNAFVGGTTDFTTSYKLTFYSDAAGTTSVGSFLSPILAIPGGPTTISSFLTSPTFGSIPVRSVRYTILTTAGGEANDNAGLSNISFAGARVPEPATWGLMIVGFGMVGLSARRRKAAVAA